MDEYMRENKLEGVAPVVPRGPDGKALPPPEPADSHAVEEKPASSKPAGKEPAKPASKDAGKSSKGLRAGAVPRRLTSCTSSSGSCTWSAAARDLPGAWR